MVPRANCVICCWWPRAAMPHCWLSTPHEPGFSALFPHLPGCRAGPGGNTVMRNWVRQGWEQFSLYLPVVLMGLLALGTRWLVRHATMPLLPAIERQQGNQPDYFMKSFSVKSFDAGGRLQIEVQGEEARHYPDSDTLEIDKARMRSVTPQGRLRSEEHTSELQSQSNLVF